MTMALSLLCRVVRRRVEGGEELEAVLLDYPKLTDEERETVSAVAGERERTGLYERNHRPRKGWRPDVYARRPERAGSPHAGVV